MSFWRAPMCKYVETSPKAPIFFNGQQAWTTRLNLKVDLINIWLILDDLARWPGIYFYDGHAESWCRASAWGFSWQERTLGLKLGASSHARYSSWDFGRFCVVVATDIPQYVHQLQLIRSLSLNFIQCSNSWIDVYVLLCNSNNVKFNHSFLNLTTPGWPLLVLISPYVPSSPVTGPDSPVNRWSVQLPVRSSRQPMMTMVYQFILVSVNVIKCKLPIGSHLSWDLC